MLRVLPDFTHSRKIGPEATPSRRELLKAGFLGFVSLSGLSQPGEVLAQFPVRGGQPINNYLNLSGVIRNPVPYQQASPFPYYTNPFTNVYSGQYFGNYFGIYNNSFGLYSYPFYSYQPNPFYFNNNNRGYFPRNKQVQKGQPTAIRNEQSCCCCPTRSGGIEETKFKEYPVPETDEEKAAREALYTNTINALIRTAYPLKDEYGQIINQPEHLLHYLTPIVFAHDLYNQETLASIERGFQTGSPEIRRKLTETYGSLQFFQDARQAITYHKDQQAAEVTDEVLSRDRDMVVEELNKKAAEANITLDYVKERADFIVQLYHRLGTDSKKLSRIIDGLLNYISKDPEKRKAITIEQRLYIEQLRFGPNEDRNVIGPSTLLLLLMNLNDSHSTDLKGKELRFKIQNNIEVEAAKSRKQLTTDISPNPVTALHAAV
jgi:hypothetical protein